MTEKGGGFQGTYTSCFERAVIAALKQTYTVLYMLIALCLLRGEKFISLFHLRQSYSNQVYSNKCLQF